MKRVVALLIMLIVVISMFTGCATTTSDSQGYVAY